MSAKKNHANFLAHKDDLHINLDLNSETQSLSKSFWSLSNLFNKLFFVCKKHTLHWITL